MGQVLEILVLMFWSGIKFLYAAPLVFAAGYGMWETAAITVVGGWAGVVVFYYFGGWVTGMFVRGVRFVIRRRGRKKKKTFTRMNKFIVKVKRNYGLVGLSIITPTLISIPVGCIVAARYFRKDRRTIPFLLLSVLIWGVLVTPVWWHIIGMD